MLTRHFDSGEETQALIELPTIPEEDEPLTVTQTQFLALRDANIFPLRHDTNADEGFYDAFNHIIQIQPIVTLAQRH